MHYKMCKYVDAVCVPDHLQSRAFALIEEEPIIYEFDLLNVLPTATQHGHMYMFL